MYLIWQPHRFSFNLAISLKQHHSVFWIQSLSKQRALLIFIFSCSTQLSPLRLLLINDGTAGTLGTVVQPKSQVPSARVEVLMVGVSLFSSAGCAYSFSFSLRGTEILTFSSAPLPVSRTQRGILSITGTDLDRVLAEHSAPLLAFEVSHPTDNFKRVTMNPWKDSSHRLKNGKPLCAISLFAQTSTSFLSETVFFFYRAVN